MALDRAPLHRRLRLPLSSNCIEWLWTAFIKPHPTRTANGDGGSLSTKVIWKMHYAWRMRPSAVHSRGLPSIRHMLQSVSLGLRTHLPSRLKGARDLYLFRHNSISTPPTD